MRSEVPAQCRIGEGILLGLLQRRAAVVDLEAYPTGAAPSWSGQQLLGELPGAFRDCLRFLSEVLPAEVSPAAVRRVVVFVLLQHFCGTCHHHPAPCFALPL